MGLDEAGHQRRAAGVDHVGARGRRRGARCDLVMRLASTAHGAGETRLALPSRTLRS